MNHGDVSRRKILVATIAYTGLVSTGMGAALIRASSAWAQSRDESAGELVRLARLLYPHEGIADDVYAEVLRDILSDTANDSILDSAIAKLNAAQAGDWFDLDTEEQVAAMTAVENEPFFGAIQGAVRARFYNHPKVWEHIGYPGSSVEYGGYIDRGFNDIDWLPEESGWPTDTN